MNNTPDQNNNQDANTSNEPSAGSKAENAATKASGLLGGKSRMQDAMDSVNQARADAERQAGEASSSTGGSTVEEEFVGTGGVGSAEQMEALRRGHEAAGSDFKSDLSDPNTTA